MRSAWRWFALAAAWVLADQVTKWLVLSHFAYEERELLEPLARYGMYEGQL